MYHKVYLDSPTMWWVTVNDFYRQMVEISHKEVVYLSDYDKDNKNHIVITFDGIYENVLQYAAPILKKFNYPFELFLTSDYIGKDNSFDSVEPLSKFTSAIQLEQLVESGGRLQWHTRSHKNLKDITDEDVIKNELTIPESILTLDPYGFKWFAYPHGEFNSTVLKHVSKKFEGAVSCHQGSETNPFELNRITVTNSSRFGECTIACIIASYNYGDFLIEAIESVLDQTIKPDEILITDDCSDDDTQMISENYVKKYPNLIRYNRNESNLGIISNFNKAIGLTNSDFVFFLGADNILVSNYIEKTFKVLMSNDKVAIAYTDFAFFGSRALMEYERFPDELKSDIVDNTFYKIEFPEFTNLKDLKEAIHKYNFIHGSSMYKRHVFDSIGGYKSSNTAEDYNLFRRMIDDGWLACKAKTYLQYRQHSPNQANNLSTLNSKLIFYKEAYEEVLIEKRKIENSKDYQDYKKLKSAKKFLMENYQNPLKIGAKIYRKLFSK